MISRRSFIGASLAAATVPLLGSGVIRSVAARAATAATMTFSLQNNTGSDTAYAFVTGQAINNGNALFLLQSDGQTPYYPASPSSAGAALGADCASRSARRAGRPSRSPSPS